MTALGLGAKGMDQSFQSYLDRHEKEKDRATRSAEAAAGRAHQKDMLMYTRRLDKMDKLQEVEQQLYTIFGGDQNLMAAYMGGGPAGVEELKRLKQISEDNSLGAFNELLTVNVNGEHEINNVPNQLDWVRNNYLSATIEGKKYTNPYTTTLAPQLKLAMSLGDPKGFKEQIEITEKKIFGLQNYLQKNQNLPVAEKKKIEETIKKQQSFSTRLTKKFLELNKDSPHFEQSVARFALTLTNQTKKSSFGDLIEMGEFGRMTEKFEGNYNRVYSSYQGTIEALDLLAEDFNPDNPNAGQPSAKMFNAIGSNRNNILQEYKNELKKRISFRKGEDQKLTDRVKVPEIPTVAQLSSNFQGGPQVDPAKVAREKIRLARTLTVGDVINLGTRDAPVYQVFKGFAAQPNHPNNPLALTFYNENDIAVKSSYIPSTP